MSFSYYLGIIVECFSGTGQSVIARIQRHIRNLVHSEPCQTSKMDFLARILYTFQPLSTFEKSAI